MDETAADRLVAVAAARPSAGIARPSRRSRKTRGALIDAARELLEADGVQALTVKAITDRADVGHGTFYHHFASTEAVLAAGIEESMREFSQELERGFADAADKSWVFTASFTGTFRMLATHPALPWMLERTQLLAEAIREACGPFARRDVAAMVTSGDIAAEVLERAGRYWEWLIIGALVDAARKPAERARIEAKLLELVMRILGFDDAKIASLQKRVASAPLRRPARSAADSPK